MNIYLLTRTDNSGSGYYDSNNNSKCQACNGTGVIC